MAKADASKLSSSYYQYQAKGEGEGEGKGKGKGKLHPFANYLYSLCSRSGKEKTKTKGNSPTWMKIYPHFNLEELRKATNNFDPGRRIKQDASFTLYQASLSLSNEESSWKYPVSLMRLKQPDEYQPDEYRDPRFEKEMELLSNLHHPNIVSPMGYCIDKSDRIIVHSPTPNGTLHDHLHNKSSAARPLSWKRRLQICIGVARGLECLHTSNPLIIIHSDIKSSNILLDQNWVAKIFNFQVSELVSPSLLESDGHVSARVAGTLGYLDPEFVTTGRLTLKTDVYSFGIVLFEVLSGRKAMEFDDYEGTIGLNLWARLRMEDGKVDEIVDPRIKDEIAPECLKAYADLAYKCSNGRAEGRPAIGEVVKRLQLVALLQECIEADVPFSPSWLTCIVTPPRLSEQPPWVAPLWIDSESEISDDYDMDDLPR